MQTSIVQERGSVGFAPFTGERVYMVPFFKRHGLPRDLCRWQPTIDRMLDGIDTDKEIYLMIDQARVKASTTHRRPGVHIDGHWLPARHPHQASGHKTHIMPRHGRHGHVTKYMYDEAIILASDVSACTAYEGTWEGQAGPGGDCQHIDLTGLRKIPCESNRVYAGNVCMLHESMPVPEDCLRTVVRLNVPGWTPS